MNAKTVRGRRPVAVLIESIVIGLGVHVNGAAVGQDVGGALDAERLRGSGIEGDQANGRSRRHAGRGFDSKRDRVGGEAAQQRLGIEGDRHMNRLGGKIDIHIRRARDVGGKHRRQVRVEGIQSDLLLVGFRGVHGQARCSSQHRGVGGCLYFRFHGRSVRHVERDRGGDHDGDGAEAEYQGDLPTGIGSKSACQASPGRLRIAMHVSYLSFEYEETLKRFLFNLPDQNRASFTQIL